MYRMHIWQIHFTDYVLNNLMEYISNIYHMTKLTSNMTI